MRFLHRPGRHSRGPRRAMLVASVAVALLGVAAPARALIITPTFDASITSDPNAAAIEGTINQAIQTFENLYTNPVTINITYKEGGGLGSSSTFIQQVSYSTFLTALQNDGPPDATRAIALAGLAANPPSATYNTLWASTANLRALGIIGPGGTDGTITLNTSLTTPGSPGSSLQYSLLAVTEHEMDEVLGLGSGLNLPSNFPRLPRPQDLYRFSGLNMRSFDSSSTTTPTAYFSIDNGATNLTFFNQQADVNGGDYGDWAVHSPAQVQDWEGTPGASPVYGVNEITGMDVIGYNVAAVPEPLSVALMGLGATALAAFGLRRRRVEAAA